MKFLEGAGLKTKPFKTNQEIDDYTAQANYTSLSPKRETLCFAVVINKNGVNDQYEYMLRFNLSSSDIPDPAIGQISETAL